MPENELDSLSRLIHRFADTAVYRVSLQLRLCIKISVLGKKSP